MLQKYNLLVYFNPWNAAFKGVFPSASLSLVSHLDEELDNIKGEDKKKDYSYLRQLLYPFSDSLFLNKYNPVIGRMR